MISHWLIVQILRSLSSDSREYNIPGRRRQRKRHLKMNLRSLNLHRD